MNDNQPLPQLAERIAAETAIRLEDALFHRISAAVIDYLETKLNAESKNIQEALQQRAIQLEQEVVAGFDDGPTRDELNDLIRREGL